MRISGLLDTDLWGGLDPADLPWTHEVDDAEKQNRFYVCCMSRLIVSVEEAGMVDEKRRFEVDRTGRAAGIQEITSSDFPLPTAEEVANLYLYSIKWKLVEMTDFRPLGAV